MTTKELKQKIGKKITITEDNKNYHYKILEVYKYSVLVLDIKNNMECELPLEAFK